ncbi:uncharacterized protein K02A2.6 [Hydra vulgaris]|uniref:uncharacterized protein K02A2.6 n=1 Tax=Hydra vulgaris TaxID=6087 RepID=UPI001F5F571F|nr:uncharacterized protein K02A2.6-like [Hydra vulgaris]
MSNLPEHVWDELAMDFFGPLPSGEYLFVIEDLYSRYPFVDIIKTTTASSVISKLERLFAIFGYPNKIRSDNGPPFQSEELKLYFKNVDIKHIKITPQYPQANGIVEKFMQVIGKTIKITHFMGKSWREELQSMLRNYRCAPHNTTGKSPATLLFNRNIKNKFPSIIIEKLPYDKEVRERQDKKYKKVQEYFDMKHHAKKRDDIKVGDQILVKCHKPGGKLDSKYLNNLDKEGNELARNIQFIKKLLKPEAESIQRETPVNDIERKIVKRKSYPKRINRPIKFYY